MRIFLLPSRTLKSVPLGQHAADKLLSLFVDPLKNKNVVLAIVKKMEEEFRNSLQGRKSCIKKTHTFIQDFPDGKEKGEFLGIHFESGLISMAGIKVDGPKILKSVHETIVVPEEERLLRGTERVLFVSKAMKKFSQRLRAIEVPDVGLLWNVGVNYGYLEVEGRFGLTSLHSRSWPDEYNFTGKPVRMLGLGKQITDAAESIGFNVDIKGFLHTPEAVFLDGMWKNPDTVGSLSLDQRCVSCIRTKTSDVGKISYKDEDKPYILLKLFWDTFGDDGEMDSILNEFDREIDQTSPVPGKNVFERLVSEKYIIKLIREVLLALTEEGFIFESKEENKVRLKEYLQEVTHCISSMSRSYSRGMWDQLIRIFRFESLDVEESLIINRVVEVISWRAALLLGMVISIYMRETLLLGDRPVFYINGTHSVEEIRQILSAINYVLELHGDNKGNLGMVQFTTESQVFGAAVLAAIYTKDPFAYDKDYSDSFY